MHPLIQRRQGRERSVTTAGHPRASRRRAATFVACLAAVGLLAACGGDDDDAGASSDDTAVGASGDAASASTDEATPSGGSPAETGAGGAGDVDLEGVKIVVGDQVSQIETLLRASGELDGVPYEIQWAEFAAGLPILEAINAGEVDIGAVGDTPPIFAQAAGTDFRIVAVRDGAPGGEWNTAVVVPEDSDISEPADLKGKKVAYYTGSSGHNQLLRTLEAGNLTWDDIEPVALLPADALAAFGSGEVDAWSVWDPFVALAESQGGKIAVTGEGLVSGDGFQVVRADALEDPGKEAAIGDFLVRLQRAAKWAMEHRDEWVELYAELTDLPEDVAGVAYDRYRPVYVPPDDSFIESQQATADLFFENDLIPEKIDVSEIFDDRYTDELAPGAPDASSSSDSSVPSDTSDMSDMSDTSDTTAPPTSAD